MELGEQFEAAWKAENAAAACMGSHWSDTDHEQFERYSRATGAIVDKIEAMPAATLDGLRVKARAVAWCHQGEERIEFADRPTKDLRLARSIIEDLLA